MAQRSANRLEDMSRPAVFLDRDGVLVRSDLVNGKPVAVRTLTDFELLPGVVEAVSELKRAGLITVVVTNQPDVGKGLISEDILEAMHARLGAELALDAIRVCRHRQDENCECRKPRPDMLLDEAAALDIDLSRSFMVGDRDSDIVAGMVVGCYTIFIEWGYAESLIAAPDERVKSLSEAVRSILGKSR